MNRTIKLLTKNVSFIVVDDINVNKKLLKSFLLKCSNKSIAKSSVRT